MFKPYNGDPVPDTDESGVVGGAFNFYYGRTTGELLCYVDGVGTYRPTSSRAQEYIAIMCVENDGLDQAALANLAVTLGYLTPYV